jgi:hypothetical protein
MRLEVLSAKWRACGIVRSIVKMRYANVNTKGNSYGAGRVPKALKYVYMILKSSIVLQSPPPPSPET